MFCFHRVASFSQAENRPTGGVAVPVFLVLLNLLFLGLNGLVVLGQVLGELLVGRPGEEGLLPQIGGQVRVGLANGRISSLGCKTKRERKHS